MSEFEVWAPLASRVRVACAPAGEPVLDGTIRDLAEADGWWRVEVAEASDDWDYGYLLDDDPAVLPDPRSRRQPGGVHEPSRLYPDAFAWGDGEWPGRPLPGAVIYELHIGTFTQDGTFDAAAERLDHLVDLGVTHVEILPVNDFNGVWNWGYDGVLWYATHEVYGGPDGLKRFVDACHRVGLAVVLDVVYNHLGASGNYLPKFGPYLSTGRNTWGDFVNLDGPDSRPVRDFIIDNALMWLSEFHVDGLRLDAVHALRDTSPQHLLAELSERVDALAATLGRPLTLIAESDLNDPKMVTARAREAGGPGGYGMTAQWDDDVHHSLHSLLTGEQQGYYCDFGSLAVIAKVWTHVFLHDGTFSTFRNAVHGAPVDTAATPGYRFVAFLQDHDQVGNRAAGDRLSALIGLDLLKVGATLLLTSPFTVMLWMGEEWGASTPWPFFTSHPEPELAEATRNGRLEEFGRHGWDLSTVADPQDPQTFYGAKLRWDEIDSGEHGALLETYRTLLRLRRDHPDLGDPRVDRVMVDFDEDARWLVIHRGSFAVVANLATGSQTVALAETAGEIVYATDPAVTVAAGRIDLPARSAAIIRR